MEWSPLRWLLPLAQEGTVGSAARVWTVEPSTLYRRLDLLEADVALRVSDAPRDELVGRRVGAELAPLVAAMGVSVRVEG